MNLSKDDMGLNLPMLLANSHTLDSWNTVGQFSPPIGERSSTGPLRVPLPLSFSASATSHHEVNVGSRSLFGGSSNNSEPASSPQKQAMDILEHTPPDKEIPKEPLHTQTTIEKSVGEQQTVTSPILDTNITLDTHKQQAPPPNSSPQPPPPTLKQQQQQHQQHQHQHQRDDLEIKQELVDYFQAPIIQAPPPPDSHRSHSSTEENRLAGHESDDFAQDLRVRAAAVAASKNLDFSTFVLQRNLRESHSPTESLEEKYAPLNMRKLNTSQLNSSLLSNESMSEETTITSGRLKHTTSAQDANAAAAAMYAESLSRDECDFVGSNVTLKLRAMDRTQRIIAEKLISEVLFYGQFNELEKSAHIKPK